MQERVFLPFFAQLFLLNHLVKKITLIKSTSGNNLQLFPKAWTRLFENNNFRQQGFQIAAFQQSVSKC